jgi:branched-chain amino acid transport system substrate-binding protein
MRHAPALSAPASLLLVLWSLLFALPANDARASRPEPIVLGMVNAQTGPASALGRGMLAGAKAVFDDVNRRGGVHGRPIELRVADDGYEPEQTVEQTLQLIEQPELLALFGYVGTPTTNAVLPLLRTKDVPLVSVFSGANSLRRPVTPQLINVRASYEDETERLVAQLRAEGAKTIAVVYQNDGFGLSVLAGVARALEARGAKVHAQATFQRNTVAVKMALAAMIEAEPDAVVLGGPYTPLAAFVAQARAKGLKTQFATVSFAGAENLLAALGPDAEGLLVSQVMPYLHDDRVPLVNGCRRLLESHAKLSLTYVNLEGCASARVAVAALHRAGPRPSRKALMAALDGMADLDLGGYRVRFAADEHQGNHSVFMTRVVGGHIMELR